MKLDEAKCPSCGSKNVSTANLQLRLARFLSRVLKRILRLRMRCAVCGASFWHLHVLPRIVVGYHGCHQRFARALVAGKVSLDKWKASKNSYDWLGQGIYFWEHAPGRAWQWAREHHGDGPAVVATEIKLGKCLDLSDTVFTDLLRRSYDDTVQLYESKGWELPKNEGNEQKLRRLDRLIINRLTEFAARDGTVYQTVRCPFEEGENVYSGGMIREQSHIQIAVRDRACISSRIFFVEPMEADHDE